jgi:hypothetical protein
MAAVPLLAGSLTLTEAVFAQREGGARIIGTDPLSKLSWNSFLPFVNTDFKFGAGKSAVDLTLVEMKDSRPLARRTRRRGEENFVLKFAGPAFAPLEQKTYSVEHFNLGTFELFITEGERLDNTRYYYAVINRVRS